MKILVLGASGQVGHHLMVEANKRGHSLVGTYCGFPARRLLPLDLTKPGEAEKLAAAEKPDVIISTAAWPHVDGCEQDPDKAKFLNVDVTLEAAKAAASTKAQLVFYSSDYVYDGVKTVYTEDDTPNPLSVYGRVKLEAEQAIQEILPKALIIRTAVVYGPEKREKNTIYQLIKANYNGKVFKAASDQICSPTYSPNLAAASIELVEKGAEGIFHVAGTDIMSRYDFAMLACDVMGLDLSLLQPVTTAEFGSPVKRPLNNGLDVTKATDVLHMPLLSAAEGLSTFFKHAPVTAASSVKAI
jgi:dTDP-4-dehydrorhamnose reductase